MRSRGSFRRLACVLGLGIAAQLCCENPARADIISPTPTLPVLGVPYVPTAGGGCFVTAGVCIDLGALTLTSVVSSTFNPSGQDIVADAVFSGVITTLLGVPLGALNLAGTLEQEVLGRTTSTETGSWNVDLLDLDLSGPLSGHTLTVGLDPLHHSGGTTAIASVNSNTDAFRISSFFDVFVELNLDSTPPLSTTRGPITVALAPVPEPAGLLVLAPALLGLTALRRRDARARSYRPPGPR